MTDDEILAVAKAINPAAWFDPEPTAMRNPTSREREMAQGYAKARARRAIEALDELRSVERQPDPQAPKKDCFYVFNGCAHPQFCKDGCAAKASGKPATGSKPGQGRQGRKTGPDVPRGPE